MHPAKPLGVYVHVPYCQYICHYCDFAKTANWQPSKAKEWFAETGTLLKVWLEHLFENQSAYSGVDTLFLGGGTPGLFGEELRSFVEAVEPWLTADAEISLEANPENLDQVQLWKSLGFNRLSVGVQSFQERGRQVLTRPYKVDQRQLAKIKDSFENFSFDLIYGWPSQTEQQWSDDLRLALSFDPSHLSLYNLIYEPGTTMGRKYLRGMLPHQPEAREEVFYQKAREMLAHMEHLEIANWAKKGFSCRHNRKYWQDEYVLALGPGACGYLDLSDQTTGLRYRQPKALNRKVNIPIFERNSLPNALSEAGIEVEERGPEEWLTEYVGSALRTQEGMDLAKVQRKAKKSLTLTPDLSQAVDDGIVTVTNQRLVLDQREWFREVYWCLKVLDAFDHE